MKRAGKSKDESGQVIVEFVIVFGMIMTLIFLFVQLSWGIAWGHFAHYSTYMASRAYMAAANTKSDQASAAAAVLTSTLKVAGKDVFPFLSPSRPGGDRDTTGPEPVKGAMVGMHPEMIGKENTRLYSWAEGVQYNFNIKMFLLPISAFVAKGGKGDQINPVGGGKAVSWKGVIPFTSDSFLGREVTTTECISQIHTLSADTGINRGDNADFIEDNGC